MPFMARYDPFSPTFQHPLLNSSPDYGSRNGTFSTRPIGGFGGSQMSFRERNKMLKDLDSEKNQLIEDLLYQYETCQEQLRKLRLDTQYTSEFRSRETSLQDQLRQTKAIMDRNSFVMALIDGDGTIFHKDLLCKGEKGGKEAAALLTAAMTDLVSQRLPHLESPKLVLRICADLLSLSDLLVKSRFVDKPSTFDDFVRGFNSSQALFEFVDAGNKKDAAADKLCELLKLNLYDCHCHQVIFGCSDNQDYVRILDEVLQDKQVVDHLTLLEATPFNTELADLQSHFTSARFDNIFSITKPVVPVATAVPKPPPGIVAALPALTRVDSNKTNANSSASSTPALNWANVTAQATAQAPAPPPALKPVVNGVNGNAHPNGAKRTVTPSSTPAIRPGRSKEIQTNRAGQRIDKTDSTIVNAEIQRIKKLKLCNIYYLQGTDLCTASNCSHRHDYPISNSERKTLREVARMTPCFYKTNCSDADCIYGHRCPQSEVGKKDCYYAEDCRFYGWGHGIDTRVVKVTKV